MAISDLREMYIPPAMLPARGAFLSQDLPRSAALYDVPMLPMPCNFFSKDLQKSAIGVARLMCAAQLDGATDAALLDLAVAVSDRVHADPAARSDDGALTIDAALLTKACCDAGLEAKCASLLEFAQGDAAKKALRANTEEAVARGAEG